MAFVMNLEQKNLQLKKTNKSLRKENNHLKQQVYMSLYNYLFFAKTRVCSEINYISFEFHVYWGFKWWRWWEKNQIFVSGQNTSIDGEIQRIFASKFPPFKFLMHFDISGLHSAFRVIRSKGKVGYRWRTIATQYNGRRNREPFPRLLQYIVRWKSSPQPQTIVNVWRWKSR